MKSLKILIKKCSSENIIKQFKKNNIEIKSGQFFFKGKEIHTGLTSHIVNLFQNKLPLDAAIAFFERIMKNPSEASRNELFDFMQTTKLPLTSRGTFLAYRSINKNWKDNRTNSMDNRIGKIVKMNRKDVDANRHETCSRGLHFSGYEYNKHFKWGITGGFLTIVEIDPKDVVSIPIDYQNQKGRCCKFKVLDVAKSVDALEDLWYFDAKVATKEIFVERLHKATKATKTLLRKRTVEELAVMWMGV